MSTFICLRQFLGLADKDEAFRLLEKGYEKHSASMLYLPVDSFYSIRSDPRYADLLRRMGCCNLPRRNWLEGIPCGTPSD